MDGHAEIIKMFLDKGVPVNVKDSWGRFPLLNAADENAESVKLLVDAGADVNMKEEEYKKTPLHDAARYGLVEAVKILLAKGADVNARNSEGVGDTVFLSCVLLIWGSKNAFLKVLNSYYHIAFEAKVEHWMNFKVFVDWNSKKGPAS